MNDQEIIELFFSRSEDAVSETGKKYGKMLKAVAFNVLSDSADAEECVNDTYLRAWDSIPPERPEAFSAYLAKIVRNLAIDLYRKKNNRKRAASRYEKSLDELSEVVSGSDTPETELSGKMLSDAIDRYLRDIPETRRRAFVMRYFYNDSLAEISQYINVGVPALKSVLHRERKYLSEYLKKEGFEL